MLHQHHFPATVLAAALLLPAGASLASSTVALRGDGHCPIPELATDPDCAREGAQRLNKSSRDEFPKCRAAGGGGPVVYTCPKPKTRAV